MSLYALQIKNYRTHENLCMSFHWGVNAIVGLPDSGKTNILRAMDWVIRNRPLGFRFHSDFAVGPTVVSITTMDDPEGDYGWQVRFAKDKQGAEYDITDGRTSEKLKAVGSDVPDQVQQLLNLNDLNMQKQLDQPFLICSSPAEVTKVLNQVTRLEKTDAAISSITTDINSTNKEMRILQQSIEEGQSCLKRFEKLDELEAVVGALERFEEIYNGLRDRREKLHEYVTKYADLEKKKEQYAALDSFETHLDVLEKADAHWRECREQVDRLRVVTTQVSGMEGKADTNRLAQQSKMKGLTDMLHSMKTCPFCRMCKTPMKEHSIDELLQEV
jgi:chromosome segregation ATPase